MGYICHNAIIVTGWSDHHVQAAWQHLHDLLTEDQASFDALPVGILSPVSEVAVNGQRSFALWPDGSKEGWGTSDRGNEVRSAFLTWLEDSPEVWVEWCEVRFGDEADMNGMLRCSGEPPSLLPPALTIGDAGAHDATATGSGTNGLSGQGGT